MALQDLRRKENVPGDFFVDETCIDCDLCRQIAPAVFSDVEDQSAVTLQPASAADEFAALQALVTCPTASIGTMQKRDLASVISSYPQKIEDDVYFCGFAAESSYGASSYLIVRPEGNVLVDSPRFNNPLAENIERLGGVRWMYLTHRDDVADHDAWARRFSAERIIHEADAGHLRGRIETLLSGEAETSLAPDLKVIPTPGHTRGHTVLLYRNRFLFSGDHLWWSDHYRGLHASRSVCWYSWPEQVRSVKRLLDHEFAWVLPGHGRRHHAPPEEMHELLRQCIDRINSVNRRTEEQKNSRTAEP